jgi:hypothetical protein
MTLLSKLPAKRSLVNARNGDHDTFKALAWASSHSRDGRRIEEEEGD